MVCFRQRALTAYAKALGWDCLMCLRISEEACVAGVQGSRGRMGGGEGRIWNFVLGDGSH